MALEVLPWEEHPRKEADCVDLCCCLGLELEVAQGADLSLEAAVLGGAAGVEVWRGLNWGLGLWVDESVRRLSSDWLRGEE